MASTRTSSSSSRRRSRTKLLIKYSTARAFLRINQSYPKRLFIASRNDESSAGSAIASTGQAHTREPDSFNNETSSPSAAWGESKTLVIAFLVTPNFPDDERNDYCSD